MLTKIGTLLIDVTELRCVTPSGALHYKDGTTATIPAANAKELLDYFCGLTPRTACKQSKYKRRK